jgi:hypothetical protein
MHGSLLVLYETLRKNPLGNFEKLMMDSETPVQLPLSNFEFSSYKKHCSRNSLVERSSWMWAGRPLLLMAVKNDSFKTVWSKSICRQLFTTFWSTHNSQIWIRGFHIYFIFWAKLKYCAQNFYIFFPVHPLRFFSLYQTHKKLLSVRTFIGSFFSKNT